MKKKNLAIMLGALAALIVGTRFAETIALKREAEATEEPERVVIFSIVPDEVTELSYEYSGETLEFVRNGDIWEVVGELEFPLDQNRIEGMLSALETINAEKTMEAASREEDYGLEKPTVKITADGKTLLIGNEQEMDGYLYASTEDGNVYLTDASVIDAFSYVLDDLIENERLPEMTDISSFTVSFPNGEYEIVRLKDEGIAYSNEYEYFMKDGDGYITLGTDAAQSFIENVTKLRWLYCADWNAGNELLESTGLSDPPVTVTVRYNETEYTQTEKKDSDGNPIQEAISVPKTFRLDVSGPYAKLEDSRMVYYIGSDLSDTLTYTTAAELRPEDVLALDFSDVYSVDVSLGGQNVTFEKAAEAVTDEEGVTEVKIVWKTGEKEADFEQVTDIIAAMSSQNQAGEYAQDGEMEIALLLHRSDGLHPETEISFSRYDSTRCLTRIDGEPTVFVARSDTEELVSAVEKLIGLK